MSLLTPETGLLFWMLLSFGIVVFILVKFGFPAILQMIEKRKSY
jgi:F-type H+-transporting ATPase subunit b